MPQVDLETIVSVCGGGNDRKIACETLADGDNLPENPDLTEVPPDFPPESFWLSKDAEYDWFDRNAFYERKESTKGNSNSSNQNPNSNSSSQRFSLNLKSKASIIGLPKTQKASYVDTKRRTCKPANIRLFPKRSESVGKSTVPVTEPSSPKVSCMGRVRSKRGRRKQASQPAKTVIITTDKEKTDGGRRKTGLYSRFMSVFRSTRRSKRSVERIEPPVDSPPRKSVTIKVREMPLSAEKVGEPPGLGGMTRFASGRRSTSSWGTDDLDQMLDVRVSISEPSDRDCRV
ncbi:uncharacterized protein LOC132293281 [Cornus florida]|uniref:uncharacterized protein LOC132293281 n=1 Tax=Cornus florida TaxID=4283 RepID=UPI00289BB2BE|nr:uncharacterized protein LOC132293281 [Cornus florida]